jgi:hypothetical protein
MTITHTKTDRMSIFIFSTFLKNVEKKCIFEKSKRVGNYKKNLKSGSYTSENVVQLTIRMIC